MGTEFGQVRSINRKREMKMEITAEISAIQKRLQKESTEPLKIALYGQTGAGKSSLINTILGDEKAFVSPRADATTEAEVYEWNGLHLYDLPGYAGAKFHTEGFDEKFDIESFDLFLCVFSGKFTHADDQMFFRKIREGNRPCIMVRTHADAIYQHNKTEAELQEEIRQDALEKAGADVPLIFVSSRLDRISGIDELNEAIMGHLNEAKAQKYALAAHAYSEEALERKRAAAKASVTKYAAMAAANGLNPIPGADVAVDVTVLIKCFASIKRAYGLSDELLGDPAIIHAVPVANRILGYFAVDGMLFLLKRYAGRAAVKQIGKYIPIVGQVIAASAGFTIAKVAGDAFVDECHEVASFILEKNLSPSAPAAVGEA